MNARIFHTVYSDDEDGKEARFLRSDVQFDDRIPTQEDFDSLYEEAGIEEFESDDHGEILNKVWSHWNAGSGNESVEFARRECEDCDEVFTGEVDGEVDLRVRQNNAETHENETRHEVGHGTRSLSVADIVVIEDTAYLCVSFGWDEIDVEAEA
jgi:hypothetical protein